MTAAEPPRRARSGALAGYLTATRLAAPAIALWLRARARRGKEDPARLGERWGRPGAARPAGPLVWLHGASVGEATAILPLRDALRATEPRLTALMTTGTVTGAQALDARLGARDLHQFLPVDAGAAPRRFLAHWRPDLAVWTESEFWPRLMVETDRAGTPMALVNARLSARSAAAWARRPRMAAALLNRFRLVHAQDPESAARLRALGLAPERLRQGGTLKSAVRLPEPPPEALATARAAIGRRPVWLAASTHAGEDAAILAAHARLDPATLLILAPRHPDRGDRVADEIAAAGLPAAQRSRGERPTPETRVWLADTLGEMGLWYRLAPVAIVGGSLADPGAGAGGHTPFEPAAAGAAILHGPDIRNFAPVYGALKAEGAAEEVDGPESLARAVAALLADPDRRALMAARARAVAEGLRPDLDGIARELCGLLAGGSGR